MLAASMALGNMTHAISMFSDGRGGLQRFTTKKHLLKIYGMVRPPRELARRQASRPGQCGSAAYQASTSIPSLYYRLLSGPERMF